ncbi:MAG: OB-fold domain-containing protein [Xanthobacteraceae bacterium]
MNDKPQAAPIRPTVNDVNRPFWDGCRRGVLLLQRCSHCGRLRYPAGAVCPDCLAAEAQWQAVSGRGKVFSFVVFHRAYHPAWEGKVPYNVALIELDEGPIMLSNVVATDNAQLAVGLPVAVAFETVDESLSIPVFKPAQ